MNKLILACIPLCAFLPALAVASPCTAYNENYTLNANGATGTLAKVQVINGNNYSITSTINVSKFFMSKTIVQTATGTCDANGNIIAQNFSNSNNDNNAGAITLGNNELDTLSLVLFLSSTLSSNTPTFPVVPLLYNGNTISVQCAITSVKATVTLNGGQIIPATAITCATADNAIALNYSFSQDAAHMMLAANAIENGTTTMTAIIN
ncbi:MAG: hypothetical protein V4496_00685 [Pseudomonadota bacterium]